MRRQSRKLSGPALARWLRRFHADVPGLPPEAAELVTARSVAAFTSVRVRTAALKSTTSAARPARPAAKAPPTQDRQPKDAPVPASPAKGSAASPAAPAAPFDPYSIGLVPTFQREGRDGLINRLADIASADNLRKMARAQQIVLPEPLRATDVALDALRAGIADAVAKRVADRRAAAG